VFNTPGVVSPTIHLADGGEDHLATNLALATFAQMQPRIMMINYPEVDWPLGHVDGGNLDPSVVQTDMREFDADLARIEAAYQKAGILNRTLFVITADHGMMPIDRFIPSTVVSNAVSQAGTTAPDIASNTADYVWLADPTKAQTVADNVLRVNDSGIQSAYYLTTQNGTPKYVSANPSSVSVAEENANQYLLDALLNGHQPAVVVFGKEGATFSDPTSKWKADHGGNSWESQHIPLILAGPGIRQGVVTSAPVELQDVAPTVLTAMGVAPTGMDGQPLADALSHASPAVQKASAAKAQWLAPITAAIQAQSNTDLGQ